MQDDSRRKNVFVSFCEDNPDRLGWVVDLVEKLRKQGVGATYYKYEVIGGISFTAYMEKKLSDPLIDKILVICDKEYVKKFDNEEGGAGFESKRMAEQIKEDLWQTKIIPVIAEVDNKGDPFVPSFLKDRAWADLSNSDGWGSHYQKLFRWIHDRPESTPPPVGKLAKHLLEDNPGVVFKDEQEISPWAKDSVYKLARLGIISPDAEGLFKPKGFFSRSEMAEILVLSSGLRIDTTGAPHFRDVPVNHKCYEYIETLYNNGIDFGSDLGVLDSEGLAFFNPSSTFNRAEFSKVLISTFDFETAYSGVPPNFSDVNKQDWFFDYVEAIYSHGLLNGYEDGKFHPNDNLNREQAVVVIQAAKDEIENPVRRRSDYNSGTASNSDVVSVPIL